VKVPLLVVALVVAVLGAPFAWWYVNRQPAQVTFSTVSAGKLAVVGIALTVPAGQTPSAAAGHAAAAAASKAFGGKAVLEYHYAHCVDTQSAPHVNEDCWAVSLDPSGLGSGGPRGAEPQGATYLLVLVDPATDTVIRAADGS
jgi:hypothetical protein